MLLVYHISPKSAPRRCGAFPRSRGGDASPGRYAGRKHECGVYLPVSAGRDGNPLLDGKIRRQWECGPAEQMACSCRRGASRNSRMDSHMGYKMKGAGPFEIAKARSGRNQPDRLLSGRAALPVFADRPCPRENAGRGRIKRRKDFGWRKRPSAEDKY